MHSLRFNRFTASRKAMIGLTLIELMVAVAISGFLMIGAITVFMQARTSFRINESVARLQENARFVLDTLEPDIRMSHFWGLNTRTYAVVGRAEAADPHAGFGDNDCGDNWAIDLENVRGSNNEYDWDCDPRFGEAVEGADTLMVRRVSQAPVNPAGFTAGTVFIQSARGGTPAAQIFTGSAIPADFNADTSDTFRLIAHGYYVDEESSLGAAIPSLRRKTLAAGGVINDEEILPGVEDLQVEYGVDTNPVGAPTRGSITRYVAADDGVFDPLHADFAADAEVLAIRIWVRLRAERPENGFVDTAEYIYADRDEGPFNDAFRRLVVSKTIYLRNARPAS